jgi:pyruvate dehydrogenase E2 component (dihydrolipoamide acetyltransferase)
VVAPAVPAGDGTWPSGAGGFAKFGPVETKPRSRIKKLSAANLHRNWVMIPHVTQFDEADITDLEAFRKTSSADTERQGFKLTMLAFLIKASSRHCNGIEFNARSTRRARAVIRATLIGVAVDTRRAGGGDSRCGQQRRVD